VNPPACVDELLLDEEPIIATPERTRGETTPHWGQGCGSLCCAIGRKALKRPHREHEYS